MFQHFVLIALGGAIGSVLRYAIHYYFALHNELQHHWATFFVNIIGSLLIGFLFIILEKHSNATNLKLLLMIGFCGGFTTFSTFNFENYKLMIQHQYLQAFLYILSSIIFGIASIFIGVFIGKFLLKFI